MSCSAPEELLLLGAAPFVAGHSASVRAAATLRRGLKLEAFGHQPGLNLRLPLHALRHG